VCLTVDAPIPVLPHAALFQEKPSPLGGYYFLH
jgi:hypothetical protein